MFHRILSLVRWGSIVGIVWSMLSSLRWRAYSNVRKVLAAGFSSCRSKSRCQWRSPDVLDMLSFTSVVSVGRMSSYKWASELPGSFQLSRAYQSMESFSRPTIPAVGGPSTGSELVPRANSRRVVCRIEEINRERCVGWRRALTSRTRKLGKLSRNSRVTSSIVV